MHQTSDRLVAPGHDPLLHRDDRVVGDLDVFRAHLGAAFGDVAQPDAVVLPPWSRRSKPSSGCMASSACRMKNAQPGVPGLVVLAVTDHTTHVLAQPALDALAELLAAPDVDVHHPIRTTGQAGRRPHTFLPCSSSARRDRPPGWPVAGAPPPHLVRRFGRAQHRRIASAQTSIRSGCSSRTARSRRNAAPVAPSSTR